MTAPKWSESGRIKVKRAKEHIRDLEVRFNAFIDAHPYSVSLEDDIDRGRCFYQFHAPEELPPLVWGAIAGEAAHNLRSALDYLYRNAWYPGGGGLTNYRCAFPIEDDADALIRRFSPEMKGRKKRIVDLVAAFKPYKGGNDHLWWLRLLNDVDKHRLLLPTFAVVSDIMLDAGPIMRPRELAWLVRSFHPNSPVEDGAELLSFPIEHRKVVMDMDPEFFLQVAFGEGKAIKGKHIIPTLNAIANEVEEVAEAFLTAKLVV